ncbi:bifunctional folylpolyglutamate synthase/dihydrofolate synthase [Desulfurivibrio dismutans]|uniref:bifunctional folylpolyglutamate synthase/dihydrofolate synthase n=1 Tax=Desulfurivibrio dismutans TaxID=1398908 RepID=UPI0023DABC3C|nr:folylpolyglutamate synthase/dihydrofolate synthase family protein [Desulfurivibrio alkaliphilus]MDF1613647.1 bifunctional folylpolyglutamate synthase/dihydrofolate synthase [Desulfurivibrio alkaliphilus]
MMDYQQAWDYLDRLQFFKIKLGLDSMERFLGRLGEPQRQLRFIHVAGTNGKGSVASALLAVLSRAGYRAGLYTSPHLSCVRERFRINDEFISRDDFARQATAIHDVLGGDQITYFEFTTALALLWFATRQVDVAILEVGLGGRLDATNVITPQVGVITNVSMDHQAYLGNTLAEVAAEKAGIIKPGVPLVSGVAADESRAVVARRCRELSAPLYLLGRDFAWYPDDKDATVAPGDESSAAEAGAAAGAAWNYRGLHDEIGGLRCRLRGRHQQDNLSLALATLELLTPVLPVTVDDIRAGIGEVSWPGRLEYLEVHPSEVDGPRRVLLDGAHNPAGIAALVAALKDDFSGWRLVVVWASMVDKDVAAGLGQIAPLADELILTRPESERSATPAAMRQMLPVAARGKAREVDDTAMALEQAWRLTRPEDLVVVAGSLYLVGAARRLLAGELVRDEPPE